MEDRRRRQKQARARASRWRIEMRDARAKWSGVLTAGEQQYLFASGRHLTAGEQLVPVRQW